MKKVIAIVVIASMGMFFANKPFKNKEKIVPVTNQQITTVQEIVVPVIGPPIEVINKLRKILNP